jgi:hypothetical protein
MVDSLSKGIISLILVVFLFAVMVSPVLAKEGRIDSQKDERDDDGRFSEERYSHFEQEGWDEMHHCKSPIPASFTADANLTIDITLISATPHWFLLAAGRAEQNALLNYISHADVSQQTKASWTRFMKRMWMKYPVRYVKTGTSAKLVPGTSPSELSMTSQENATFKEIELYIAEDMARVSAQKQADESSVIMPMFATTEHSSFAGIACDKEKVPPELKQIMVDNAAVPDSWYDYPGGFVVHSLEHGYIPYSGLGLAPDKAGSYASLATADYASHAYDEAFTNLGYASHFVEDLGNPFHTPMAQMILLQYIDDPTIFKLIAIPTIGTELVNYKAVHDNFEGYVDTFWDKPLPAAGDPTGKTFSSIASSVTTYVPVTNPVTSAQTLAEESWKMSPDLFWDCYLRFTKTRMFDFENDSVIVGKTRDRVMRTEGYTWGLVRFLTNGQPVMISMTASAGPGGSISPSGTQSVLYDSSVPYVITSDTGYVIESLRDNENPVEGAAGQETFPYDASATLSDHTISASFRSTIFTITPSAGPHGTITPSTAVTVPSGGRQTFTITPDLGYKISQLLADGVPVEKIPTMEGIPFYTFNEVNSDHTISVTFAERSYTITPTAGPHGTITPSTAVSIPKGGSQTFTISPESGYTIDLILVDGVSQGAIPNYTFSGVTSGHTISASFKALETFTITPSAGPGGTITPSTVVTVPSGGSQTFTITPDSGYEIDHVYVDGVNAGASPTVTLAWITYDRTIMATFKAVENDPIFLNHCFLTENFAFPDPIPNWIFNADPWQSWNWNYAYPDPYHETHCNGYTWIGNMPATPAPGIVTLYQEAVDLTGATGVRLHTDMRATGSASVTLDVDGVIDSELARNTDGWKYGGYGDYVYLPFSTPRTGAHTVGFTCRKDASDGYSAITLADVHLMYAEG